MKFEIGQQVRIRKDSIYYTYNNPYNPKDIEGKIKDISTSASLNIRVTWNNNKENSYSESDLELVQEANQMKKYKVLKDFDGKKVNEIIIFSHSIDTIQWKDSNGFTVQTTIQDLISKGFIQEYKEEYKIGEWYFYDDNYSSAIFKYSGKFDAYSSNTDLGILYDAYTEFKKLKVFEGTEGNNFCTTSDIKRLATQDEIKKALIEIAKYKGFKVGTKYKSLLNGSTQQINLDGFYYSTDHNSLSVSTKQNNDINFKGSLIYEKGKWAEIIKEPKLEIASYEVLFNLDNTVSVGCKKGLSKDYFTAMIKVQEFCTKYNVDLKFYEDGVIGTQDGDFEVQDQINQINEKLK